MNSFSVIYRPTALFSLKESGATNSGAKSLFIPSPYSIKMAILNQAITLDGVNFEGKKNRLFQYVRDAKISFYLKGDFCVNNCFVKILKKKEDKRGKKAKAEGQVFIPGFQKTISFREYVFMNEDLEIIFEVNDVDSKDFIKKYLHKINYFGKRGCFFQFIGYSNSPTNNNVLSFSSENLKPGILQEYDDFDTSFDFDNVNSFSQARVNRKKEIFLLPFERINSSKSYSRYQVFNL